MKSLRKALILAAGHGTRLLPLTADCPKVMLPVRGKPLLERHLEWLSACGIEEICINLHAHPEAIRDRLGDGSRWGVHLAYHLEPRLRGTAGALHGFRDRLNARFLVHYGDVYSELDVIRFNAAHEAAKAEATLAVHPSSHPEDSDIVELDASGRVAALHHKPGDARFGNLGNAACYILEQSVFEFLDPSREQEDFVKDVFPRMLQAKSSIHAFHNENLVFDMGTPERYRRLEERLAAQ